MKLQQYLTASLKMELSGETYNTMTKKENQPSLLEEIGEEPEPEKKKQTKADAKKPEPEKKKQTKADAKKPEPEKKKQTKADAKKPEPEEKKQTKVQENKLTGVLTNQMNLNFFSSRRMITPRETLEKYYNDLLELTPTQIPIVATPLSEEHLERVVRRKEGGAILTPVFIETREQPEGTTPFPIPFEGGVIAIHFENQKDLDSYASTPLGNVPDFRKLFKASPELFAGGETKSSEIVPMQVDPSVEKSYERLWNAEHFTSAFIHGLYAINKHATSELAQSLELLIDDSEWSEESTQHLIPIRSLRKGEPLHPESETLFDDIVSEYLSNGIPGKKEEFLKKLVKKHPENSALEKVLGIINGTERLEPFEKADQVPLELALLLSLQKKIEELPNTIQDLNATPVIVFTAAILIGVATKRGSTMTSMRPEALDIALAVIEEEAFIGAPMKASFKIGTTSGHSVEKFQIKKGENILAEIQREIPLSEILEAYLKRSPKASEKDDVDKLAWSVAKQPQNDYLFDYFTYRVKFTKGLKFEPGEFSFSAKGFTASLEVDWEGFLKATKLQSPTGEEVDKLREKLHELS
jgi:hypothetical protein